MRTIVASLSMLSLLAGCKREPPPAAKKPPEFQFFFEPSGPSGVVTNLDVSYYAKTSFADLSSTFPEDGWAGAMIEGNSFDGPSDLYVVSLRVANSSSIPVAMPDVLIRASTMLDGEPELRFRPAPRGTLEPGQEERIHFLWDPGQRVPVLWARLQWGP